MQIGVIGAGHIGGALASHWARLRHDVQIANSRGPETLTALDGEMPYATYHVTNPYYGDGVSLDVVVDWMGAAGYCVKRIHDYDSWYRAFEERLKALGEPMRQHLPLGLLQAWEHPIAIEPALDDSRLLARLRAISPNLAELPNVNEALIDRMLADMVELHVIEAPR